ncbi:MAG: glycosyltransferase family 39 protein [Phycisphaeraceae bacterium]|nr:glycosyltransferase family 39 protein [Phycisphaeraceae bacterium]
MTNESATSPRRRLAILAVVALSMLLPWFSPGDHALYSPDEGRYASVALNMVYTGDWLTPRFRDEAHLTKPPMAYWLIGASIEVFGRTTEAVRAPGILCGSLCVLIVFLVGMTWRGPTAGAIAAGVYALMPLFLFVTRFAVTDPVLNLCWTGALATGWMAARRETEKGSGRWAALFWCFTAMGLMVKGPAALIPALILLLWTLIGGNRAGLRRLRVAIGLPLCTLPVIAWGLSVLATNDQALSIWKHELFDRAVGSGDHPAPIWYFLPIFLAGMYPATAMLVIPGYNITLERARANLRNGETSALWALATLVPIVIFSLISGKLPSYILPACAPLALLTADMLWRRVRRVDERTTPGFKRAPDVVVTFAVTACIIGVGGIVAASIFQLFIADLYLALALLSIGSVTVLLVWTMRPSRRLAALAIAWGGGLALWGLVFEAEDAYTAIASPEILTQRLEELSGGSVECVDVLGFQDPSLWFYLGSGKRHYKVSEYLEHMDSDDHAEILLVDQGKWRQLLSSDPAFTSRYVELGIWSRRWTHPTLILKRAPWLSLTDRDAAPTIAE